MKKLSSLVALLALVGCTDQNKSPSSSNDLKLPAFVAVSYELPANVPYTMRCDLNSAGGLNLNPGIASNVSKSDKVFLNGWLATEKLEVPSTFLIVLKGTNTYAISGKAGLDRPDVVQALSSQTVAQSGYGFEADIKAIPVGQYAVHILADKKSVGCDTTKLLNIVE